MLRVLGYGLLCGRRFSALPGVVPGSEGLAAPCVAFVRLSGPKRAHHLISPAAGHEARVPRVLALPRPSERSSQLPCRVVSVLGFGFAFS